MSMSRETPAPSAWSARAPQIEIVPLDELLQVDREWTRGHAHHRMDDLAERAPGRISFGPLRLFALQDVDAGHGYAMHGHANVEVITMVLAGSVLHRDSLGVEECMPAEVVATMSAGRGLQHAEYADVGRAARVIQIWLEPRVRDTPPVTAHACMPRVARRDRFRVLVSGRACDAGGEALYVQQDASLISALMSGGRALDYRVEPGRCVYLVPLDAGLRVEAVGSSTARPVGPGERVLVHSPGRLRITAAAETEVVMLDMAV
jgi:redox-sensitive bicupin YhaK (pirin superfamily)